MQKVVNMDGAASQNPKLADLAKDNTHYDSAQNARMNTDCGNKVSNTNHWLTASTEDHIRPSLLKDGTCTREGQSHPPQISTDWRWLTLSQIHRFKYERIP